jgi:hypothetical protein
MHVKGPNGRQGSECVGYVSSERLGQVKAANVIRPATIESRRCVRQRVGTARFESVALAGMRGALGRGRAPR